MMGLGRWTAVAVLVTMLWVSPGMADAISDLARQGDTAYREANYQAAISAYTQLLESGYVSGSVYYNLGNSYFKTGELALAILYFERAAREMPHDRDVRYNLELAQSRTVDRIEAPPRLPVWNWIDTLRDLVAPSTLAWGTWIIASAGALVFALSLFVARSLRFPLRIVSIVCGVVFIAMLSLLGLRYSADHAPPVAIVMVDLVVVRTAPDASAQEAFHLHEGTRIEIVDELQGFREVRLADGRQGWMPRNAVETVE